jgi:hypothetical protein
MNDQLYINLDWQSQYAKTKLWLQITVNQAVKIIDKPNFACCIDDFSKSSLGLLSFKLTHSVCSFVP